MGDIAGSIDAAVKHLSEHPEEARYTDSVAIAVVEEGLRVRVEGPNGASVVTDMPAGVGGGDTAPSPGWLFRAALASCAATLLAMEAAREDVRLGRVGVTVESESDDRGILGVEADVPGGPLSVRLRIDAGSVPNEVVERAISRCPVTEALGRVIPLNVEIVRPQ
jgi:uncharacterized OsmC-like protein